MEDDDGQGDRADVEDPAGEEEGEEGAEGLDKVDLVLQGLLELLAADHPVLYREYPNEIFFYRFASVFIQ